MPSGMTLRALRYRNPRRLVTQAEIADALGIGRETVIAVETGRIELSAEEYKRWEAAIAACERRSPRKGGARGLGRTRVAGRGAARGA